MDGTPGRNPTGKQRNREEAKRCGCDAPQISGLNSIPIGAQNASKRKGDAASDGCADEENPGGAAQDRSQNVLALSAKRHADANLTSPLPHQIGEQTKQTDAGKSNGEESENAGKTREEARGCQGIINLGGLRRNLEGD